MKNTLTSVLVALLVGLMVLGAGFAGPVAADHASGNEDVLIHANETASDDLAEIWVDVAGADSINTADNTTTVTVTVAGINGTNSTELHSETLTITEGNVSTSTYSVADADSSDYETLEVSAEAATDTGQYINDSTTEWGTLVENVGGGGGLLPSGGAAGGIVALVVLGGAAYVVLKED